MRLHFRIHLAFLECNQIRLEQKMAASKPSDDDDQDATENDTIDKEQEELRKRLASGEVADDDEEGDVLGTAPSNIPGGFKPINFQRPSMLDISANPILPPDNGED